MLRKHFEPFFEERPIGADRRRSIRRYFAAKKREGLATKTVADQLVFLHGLFAFALKRGWCRPTRSPPSTGREPRGATPTSAS